MAHYICTGTCKGVAQKPGTCQTQDCPRHNKVLKPCDCTDDQHNGRQDNDEEEDSN